MRLRENRAGEEIYELFIYYKYKKSFQTAAKEYSARFCHSNRYAVLVLANAFAHGISEVLFNEIVSYVSGHVSVSFTKGGNASNQVFHDGARMRAIINERVPQVKRIDEAIGVFARGGW
jgi:hypothetical protein